MSCRVISCTTLNKLTKKINQSISRRRSPYLNGFCTEIKFLFENKICFINYANEMIICNLEVLFLVRLTGQSLFLGKNFTFTDLEWSPHQ